VRPFLSNMTKMSAKVRSFLQLADYATITRRPRKLPPRRTWRLLIISATIKALSRSLGVSLETVATSSAKVGALRPRDFEPFGFMVLYISSRYARVEAPSRNEPN